MTAARGRAKRDAAKAAGSGAPAPSSPLDGP
jgi:hypothetical protein